VHRFEHRVEAFPAALEGRPRDEEVVRTHARAQAQDETATRQPVDRRRLFGEQHRIAQRREQRRRQQSNAFGDARDRGQRGELLVGRIGDASDHADGGEAARFGPLRPLEKRRSVDARRTVGENDAYVH
jgi:hypothetical protein